jgi:hypothetical protein
VRSLKVDRVFLLGYLIGLPLLLVAYMLSPEEYPVLALDDLQQGQSKTEVLNFLYTSLLTKITTWYQGMVGCVFGIFFSNGTFNREATSENSYCCSSDR